jgi:hypothetical protein
MAQQVQWANKIIGNASDDKNAKSILGYPDALQLNEQNKEKAWHPNQKLQNANIYVGFRTPMCVKQVIIAANCAIGNITSVMLIDIFGRRIPIFTSQPSNPYVQHHLWHLRLPKKTDFEVEAIYVEANPTLSTKYVTEIDAIGITSVDTTLTYEDIKNTKNNFWKDEEKFTTINLQVDAPGNLDKQPLGSAINTTEPQVAPVLSLNEDLLFFTALNRKGTGKFKSKETKYNTNQDVWVSEKDIKGNWSPAISLPEPVNNFQHNAMAGISVDGKRMYLLNNYLPDGKMVQGLSVSSFNGQNWDFPANLAVENFKNFAHSIEYAVSVNENIMLISYAKDSLKSLRGDKDLYVSFLKNNGNWSEPKYTGNVINTSKNEAAPFLAYDSKTLYYSSDGLGGYGGSDIYMTKRLDSTWTNWSEPVNLGKGINTPKWDSYFWVPVSGHYALTSSVASVRNEDLYKVDLYPSIKPESVAILSGKVTGTDSESVQADISMQQQPKTVFEDYHTTNDSDGNYLLIIPVGTKYILKVTKPSYQTFIKEIDLSNFNSLQKMELNFQLEKIK